MYEDLGKVLCFMYHHNCLFLFVVLIHYHVITLNILSDMLVPEFIVNKVKKKSTQQLTFYFM